MPTIEDVYGIADTQQAQLTIRPEVQTPPAVVPVKVDALTRFGQDAGSAIKADALELISVKVRPVETAEQAAVLAERRAQVKLCLKDIEHRRNLVVAPLKQEAAAVDAEAHRWADPLVAWDKDAERALIAFRKLESDRARREAQARDEALAAAAQKQLEAEKSGDVQAAEAASVEIMRAEAAPAPAEVKGWKTDTGSQSVRSKWKVEVINAEIVPPAYLVPDLAKLQKAVDAGARAIEGCHIFEDESLPVRTRG